jgi:hypothetical protein
MRGGLEYWRMTDDQIGIRSSLYGNYGECSSSLQDDPVASSK